MNKSVKYCINITICFIFNACQTFYQQHSKVEEALQQQDYVKAEKQIEKMRKKRKNLLLYYLHKGSIAHMNKKYAQSNSLFEKAYCYCEDYTYNLFQESLALFTNKQKTAYSGEIHEIILIHHYKILNFLQLKQYNSALVECRRLNIKLCQLNEKYKESKKKYIKDAFIHILMGIVYQINHEYNDAYIAYSNAVHIYEEGYFPYHNVPVPQQLKKDLLYVAYKIGFYQKAKMYEKKFSIKYLPEDKIGQREVICFWHNGLGPIKYEQSINFFLFKGKNGMLHCSNDDFNLTLPIPSITKDQSSHLLDNIKMLRIAFPQYVERVPVYNQAKITVKNKTYPLVLLQDINAIAFQVLKQKRYQILSQSLLRVALKKSTEYMVSKKNKILGFFLSIWNLFNEKADTRSWQTIPYSIYYTRILIPQEEKNIYCVLQSDTEKNKKICINIQDKQKKCFIIHTPKCYSASSHI